MKTSRARAKDSSRAAPPRPGWCCWRGRSELVLTNMAFAFGWFFKYVRCCQRNLFAFFSSIKCLCQIHQQSLVFIFPPNQKRPWFMLGTWYVRGRRSNRAAGGRWSLPRLQPEQRRSRLPPFACSSLALISVVKEKRAEHRSEHEDISVRAFVLFLREPEAAAAMSSGHVCEPQGFVFASLSFLNQLVHSAVPL